jgi:aspartate carbamoyltransferase catalytic subunit
MNHLIESQQLDSETIEEIFQLADSLESNGSDILAGKIMVTLFYEPSTRTRFSFESAMLRLGGEVISTENAKEFSSASKGETLEDTIRVTNHYADVIVLRHYEKGSAERASQVSNIPIINAGDGIGQHPTQALLDLYTIKRELGRLDNLKITFVGDLKNGRTVRSLSYLLGKYKNIQINFVSPPQLAIGEDIKEYLDRHEILYMEMENFDDVLGQTDVLYQTRIQKERFDDIEEYKKHKGKYIIDMPIVDKMQEKSIIMHPLPRVDEIDMMVDSSPKAVYFKQARYGVLVRMGLLAFLLGSKPSRQDILKKSRHP